MPRQDKQQLGFSDKGRQSAEAVMEAYAFNELRDVFRLGIAVALMKKLKPADANVQRTTYINVGGLDPDHSIRSCIEVLRDDHDGRPYAFAELLAESGIQVLEKHANGGRSLREFLELLDGEGSGDGPDDGKQSPSPSTKQPSRKKKSSQSSKSKSKSRGKATVKAN